MAAWILFATGALWLFLGAQGRMAAFLRPLDFAGLSEAPAAGSIRVPSTVRAAASLTGFRVPAGHAFWLAVLQYYGDADHAAARYPLILDYCLLAADLNPHYTKIYEFGAGVLAFHVKRIDEAVLLLKQGMEANPQAVRLKLLMAAIAYQHTEDASKIIPLLEYQIQSGSRYPMLVKMLANTYLKAGRPHDAVELYRKAIRESEREDDRLQAVQNLEELYRRLRAPSRNGRLP